MRATAESFIADLDRRIDGIVDACTVCGTCADVCPTPAIAGIGDSSPEALVGGVIDILKGESHAPESEVWARKCCGTGHCIDACPEGINPRFMLTMARRRLNVEEIHVRALGGLGTQEDHGRVVIHRPHEGLQHEIEEPRLTEHVPRATHRALPPFDLG